MLQTKALDCNHKTRTQNKCTRSTYFYMFGLLRHVLAKTVGTSNRIHDTFIDKNASRVGEGERVDRDFTPPPKSFIAT